VIQVNGKLRSKIAVSSTATQDEIEGLALNDEHVQRFIEAGRLKADCGAEKTGQHCCVMSCMSEEAQC